MCVIAKSVHTEVDIAGWQLWHVGFAGLAKPLL